MRIVGFLLVGLLVVAISGLALAQDGPAKKKKKRKKKNYVLSETTAPRIGRAMEALQEEDFDKALDVLGVLAKRKRLKKYDRAVTFQMMAYTQAGMDDYEAAAKSFETSLEQDALPETTTASIRFNLGQLYLANSKFDDAVGILELWFEDASEEQKTSQAHFYLTAAYAQKEDWIAALPHARASVSKQTGKPSEQSLGLLMAIEYQNVNLFETLEVLEQLASLYPRKRYFMQLAYAYSNAGEEEKAMAMLQLAQQQGWLEKESEVTSLAQRFLFAELPYEAAMVLQKGLDEGVVDANEKNFELLATALLSAREYDDALSPLTKAAELSEDGDLFVRLAQVNLEVENWKGARESLEKAVEKGSLREPANAQILLGISNFNQKRFKSARTAFQIAAKDENHKDTAAQWLQHVDFAIEQQNDLAELQPATR
jgi:hypothetical protein